MCYLIFEAIGMVPHKPLVAGSTPALGTKKQTRLKGGSVFGAEGGSRSRDQGLMRYHPNGIKNQVAHMGLKLVFSDLLSYMAVF